MSWRTANAQTHLKALGSEMLLLPPAQDLGLPPGGDGLSHADRRGPWSGALTQGLCRAAHL